MDGRYCGARADLWSGFLRMFLGCFLSTTLLAAPAKRPDEKNHNRLSRIPTHHTVKILDQRFWAPNRLGTFLSNDGYMVDWRAAGRAGMEWPVGSGKTINFASGLWLAGIKNGEVVTAAAEFASEFQPGKVQRPAPGMPGVPEDPEAIRFRIYVIDRQDVRKPYDSPDYQSWPVADGAPVDSEGNPLLLGTSTAWAVFNDFNEELHERLFRTPPMGVEVQMTGWAWDRRDYFGDAMFFRFLCINKSGTDIDSAYVGFWADMDVGDAWDVVGCDPALALGYMYGHRPDAVYGENPPALGYVFLQGPKVPSPGDTARFMDDNVPNYKNLSMTALAAIIKGPLDLSDPEGGEEAWLRMMGLDNFGNPIIDRVTGDTTTFMFSGDPLTGEGWVDRNHSDKRFLMASGPFFFADGDSQEVVMAVIAAQGDSALGSVRLVKKYAEGLLASYAQRFEVAPPVPSPGVEASAREDAILLTWDRSAESYRVPDPVHFDENLEPTEYVFQGYNVYQLDRPEITPETEMVRLATFDVIDGVEEIRDEVYSEEFGQVVEVIVQHGSDSGLRRYVRITDDALRDRSPLVKARKYYFAVTAYASNPFGFPRALESPLEVITVRPQGPPLGTDVSGVPAFGDTLAVTHEGMSVGQVFPVVLDPLALTGHTYEVRFREAEDGVVYDVVDVTTGEVKAAGFRNQGALGAFDYPVVDGVLVQVVSPPAQIAVNEPGREADGLVEVRYGGVPLAPREFDAPGAPYGGNKVWHSLNSTRDYYVSAGGGSGELERLERSIWSLVPEDFELRFSSEGSLGWWKFSDGAVGAVPLELWRTGIKTPDDPSDDVRLLVLLDAGGGTSGVFDVGVEDPAFGYLCGDWLYAYFDGRGYEAFAGDASDGVVDDTTLGEVEYVAELIVCDFDEDGELAPSGTVIRAVTTWPNLPGDVFRYRTVAPVRDSLALAREQAGRLVNVFPNPFYRNVIDLSRPFSQQVTFTHLPESGAVIHIFTLAGDLVKRIEHGGGGPYAEWDLRNEAGRAVASGVYVVRIDMGAIGVKVLKLVIL